jgi:uncharacterized repeat protein (TIGR03803 family)
VYGTTSLRGGSGFGTVFSVNTDGSAFRTLYSFTGGTDCGNPYGGLILSGSTLYGTTTGLSSAIADGGTVFKINVDGRGYATIYTFTDESVGYNPFGALVLSGNTLYGTTYDGGATHLGTVFSVNTSGGAFTTLAGLDTNPIQFEYPVSSMALLNGVLFGTATGTAPYGGDRIDEGSENGTVFSVNTNGSGFQQLYNFAAASDGAAPFSGLLVSGNTLYGTASGAGATGDGTLFKLNADGTGFTAFHEFGDAPNDGETPKSGLVSSGRVLYGTTFQGGITAGNLLGDGGVFACPIDGSGFANLHSFTNSPGDGAGPYGGLALSGNSLYGTTTVGGANGQGVVFALNTDGSGYAILHSFGPLPSPYGFQFMTNSDGAQPYGTLIASGGVLYGTASAGGIYGNGQGTIFALNTDGSGFTNLHTFSQLNSESFGEYIEDTNGDGAAPYAGLVLANGVLYGTTIAGGTNGSGTVFSLKTDGNGFTDLYSFSPDDPLVQTNSDGAGPYGALVVSGGVLYGTTEVGGPWRSGTIFRLNANGGGFATLHQFGEFPNDGANPYAGLVLSGSVLYGVTWGGDTIFSINTDGSGYTNLYTLSPPGEGFTDGADPYGGLVSAGGVLYGTASILGGSNGGTLFSFGPPQLSITLSGSNLILTWPTDAAAFNLQSAPAVNGAYITISGATNPYTSATTNTQQFFRLLNPNAP